MAKEAILQLVMAEVNKHLTTGLPALPLHEAHIYGPARLGLTWVLTLLSLLHGHGVWELFPPQRPPTYVSVLATPPSKRHSPPFSPTPQHALPPRKMILPTCTSPPTPPHLAAHPQRQSNAPTCHPFTNTIPGTILPEAAQCPKKENHSFQVSGQ
jgi:hypothetical protein